MKTSEILREAKTRLATSATDPTKVFICLAICPPADAAGGHHPKALAVVHRIEKALGPGKTARGWLVENGYLADDDDTRDIQEYRHLWLDALIAEYEAAED